MKVLLNCANEKYRDSQRLNTQTGQEIAGFDKVISRHPADLPREYARRHRNILWHRRGAGYWLWKPYFILQTLESLSAQDVLFYCDSGSYFVHAIDPLVQASHELGQPVLTFELAVQERNWTKRDAFLLLEADRPEFTETRQRLASFSLWRKTQFSLDLAHEWLRHAEDERALTDLPNQLGQPNYSGFEDHRHDQSLLSLLAKRHQLPAFRDPSQFGNGAEAEYSNSHYPQILNLTRAKSPLTFWHRVARESKRWALTAARLWPAA